MRWDLNAGVELTELDGFLMADVDKVEVDGLDFIADEELAVEEV